MRVPPSHKIISECVHVVFRRKRVPEDVARFVDRLTELIEHPNGQTEEETEFKTFAIIGLVVVLEELGTLLDEFVPRKVPHRIQLQRIQEQRRHGK